MNEQKDQDGQKGTSEPEPSRWKRVVRFFARPKIAIPLIVVMLLITAPFVYRNYRINQLPDIDHPFDLESFLNFEVPDEENAYVEYMQAEKKLVAFKGDSEILEKALHEGWAKTPQDLKDWLSDNREALEIWKKGTEKPDVQFFKLENVTLASGLPHISESRSFAQLAVLESNRLLDEGKLQKAWLWNRALFRYSRHLGKRGFVIERLVGVAILGVHFFSFQKWIENPDVTASLLRNALREVENDFRMTAPFIDTLKAEYVFSLFLSSADAAALLEYIEDPFFGKKSSLSKWWLYFRGEPELGKAVTKHIFTNWLQEVEKVPWERREPISGKFELFDIEKNRLGSNVLDPEIIQKVALKSDIVEVILFSRERVEMSSFRDQAKFQCLRIAIAAQIYLREQGSYPEKLKELKETLGEIPDDPCYLDSRRDLQYRRENNGFVVWSVGEDGFDNGGKIGTEERAGRDIGFRITKKNK